MSKPLKKVNYTLDSVSLQDIENHKIISDTELKRDLHNLKKLNVKDNPNSFAGNNFLYHFQFKNLIKCSREDGKTIYDFYNDPVEWSKLIEQTRQRNRGGKTSAANIFECFRINKGAVVMFKSTTAKYLYQKYNATSVLDPTAGWGGRLLGAWALDINYTGIDTNIEMVPAYNSMLDFLDKESNTLYNKPKLQMTWESCLDVDFSQIEYDFVLTSPPYVNLEIYEHMKTWDNDEVFYKGFLIPLIEKCIKYIKKGGYVCFNISPKMYEDALKYGLSECDMEEDLKQQMGQKVDSLKKGKKKQDKIYIWKC